MRLARFRRIAFAAFVSGCAWETVEDRAEPFPVGTWGVALADAENPCFPGFGFDGLWIEYELSGTVEGFQFDHELAYLAPVFPPFQGASSNGHLVGLGISSVVVSSACELGVASEMDLPLADEQLSSDPEPSHGTMTFSYDANQPGTTSCVDAAGTFVIEDFLRFPVLSNPTNGTCFLSLEVFAYPPPTRDSRLPPVFDP